MLQVDRKVVVQHLARSPSSCLQQVLALYRPLIELLHLVSLFYKNITTFAHSLTPLLSFSDMCSSFSLLLCSIFQCYSLCFLTFCFPHYLFAFLIVFLSRCFCALLSALQSNVSLCPCIHTHMHNNEAQCLSFPNNICRHHIK